MAVPAQQNLDPRPIAQPAQQNGDLTAARALAGPQHRRHKVALAVEHDNRLEPVIVMEGVEQPQLLTAMHAIEGIVGIEHDAPRHLPKRGAILLGEGLGEPQ